MLTNLIVRNFKRFGEVEVALGNPVVLVGPNNSGKTSALQALALWHVGLKRWQEKRSNEKTAPKRRSGVAINRRDLTAISVPAANLLWKDLHVRNVRSVDGKQQTENVRIEILVEGVAHNQKWSCGIEFDYANEESFYCRPLRTGDGKTPERMPIPSEAGDVRVAFLPAMSGLAANETRLDRGAINVRIGEGRTAEVLRNLCYGLSEESPSRQLWERLCSEISQLFGVKLDEPKYIPERGEITMSYREGTGPRLDLSSSGRGLQQTLLLLAYMYANPRSVLLLDEPDAHLEILRQRQVYHLLTEVAHRQDSQIVAASHSEVLLNEAAGKDLVVAFLGKPHRMVGQPSQVLKALRDIGYEQYYQAEQTGWALYLEGATDLAILREFARRLDHPARQRLERPFVHYVGNHPSKAHVRFYALREAWPDLVGFALFDRLDTSLDKKPALSQHQWHRREIENYLCQPETLVAYAKHAARDASAGELYEQSAASRASRDMKECIEKYIPPAALADRSDRWWLDTKASDEFLDRVFADYFERLDLPNLLRKTSYHVLTEFVPTEFIDQEVRDVLDLIVQTAEKARPYSEDESEDGIQ